MCTGGGRSQQTPGEKCLGSMSSRISAAPQGVSALQENGLGSFPKSQRSQALQKPCTPVRVPQPPWARQLSGAGEGQRALPKF